MDGAKNQLARRADTDHPVDRLSPPMLDNSKAINGVPAGTPLTNGEDALIIDQPKNFLFATFEAGGMVAPTLTAVERLVRRGHRVRVMSDRCNREECEAAGAAFVPWTRAPSRPGRGPEHDPVSDWDAPTPLEGFMNLMDAVLVGPSLAYAEDIADELRREPADLAIVSEMLFGPQVGCEAMGQPYVLLTVNISLFPVTGAPPLGPGLPPARTPEERAFHAHIADATLAMLDQRLPALNRARVAMGLEPLQRLIDQQRAAECLFLGTSRAFDFAPDELPAGVRYVGPQLREPGWTRPWVSPFGDDGRPLALVAFSTTFQNHVGVLQRVIDAIADLPLNAVLTLGGAIRADALRAPTNVAVVDSAPHGAVMRHADLVVTHGGHGTVVRALAHEKPLLVIPHGRDQDDNAVRVTERGAGLSLPPTAATADIRAAVERLLTDRSFAAAAKRLGRAVRDEALNSPLADELERLASRAAPVGRELVAAE